jgi:hypothetical protein
MSDLDARRAARGSELAVPEQAAAAHREALDDPHETSGLQHGFQIPGWIWVTMLSAYTIFFAAIIAAMAHDGETIFVLVVSVGFAVTFFGLAKVLSALKGVERRSPLASRGGVLQTFCGPMSRGAVAAQILTVPACIAFFGLAILVIRVMIAR